MTPPLNVSIIDSDESIFDAYDKIREYIPDIDSDVFDEDFEEMLEEESYDEAEEYFEEEIEKYINENVAPDGYWFGPHPISENHGFWLKSEIEDEQIDSKANPEKAAPKTERSLPKGLAEVLDEKGETIATSPYWVK